MRFVPLVLLAACGSGGGFPDANSIDAPAPTGAFSLAWTVTDAAHQPITCDRIGAVALTVTYHNRAFSGALTEVFDCATGFGTGTGLIEGQYDFDFELDATSGALATAPEQTPVQITANQTVALNPVSFAVDATGGLALTINTGKPGGNCAPATSMGAGITSTTITLVHTSDGSCAPITFAISAGATQPAGNYTINCAAPAVGPCIEHDQMVTATGIPSDAYTIHVRGNEAATPCWSNNDAFQIPAAGMTLMHGVNLAFATGMPGC